MAFICKNFTIHERKTKPRDSKRGLYDKAFKQCGSALEKRLIVKQYQPYHYIFGEKL
jgi:hypothetical protein